MIMNKFVSALWRLLGGLTLAAAVWYASAVQPGAIPQEPIPVPIWTVETVAPAGTAQAFALDSLDRPHLIYATTAGHHYAVRQEDGWQSEDLTDEGYAQAFVSVDLALRADDTPCLVYASEPASWIHPIDTRLLYGCRGLEGWQLASIADGGTNAQLEIDANGQPHIVYLIDHLTAIYLTFHDDQWWREVIYSDSMIMTTAHLQLDADGRPHVITFGHDGLFHAIRGDGAYWQKTELPEGLGYPHAMRLSDAGQLWLLVGEGWSTGHPPLNFARLSLAWPDDADVWTKETIDEGYDWFSSRNLALDAAGRPHVAYRDTANALNYVWWTEAAEMLRHAPGYPTDTDPMFLAIGSDDQPRIVFRDAGDTKMAQRSIVVLDRETYLPGVLGNE